MYGELAELARNRLGTDRKGWAGFVRRMLQWVVPYPSRLRMALRLGGLARGVLPRVIAKAIPASISPSRHWQSQQSQQVLLLQGCAQQVMTGEVNQHLQQLLAMRGVGVTTLKDEQCCGSLKLHLGNEDGALISARRNVDIFYPLLTEYQAIVSTASGCGVTVKDYGRLLANDPEYAVRAAAVADHTVDVAEFIVSQNWSFSPAHAGKRVAWQAPCTLQHGQGVDDKVAELLVKVGYELVPVADAHLCCGSAGTYSILQPEWSLQLKANKLSALQEHQPDLIATANVGCQSHLATDAVVSVLHWVELLN
jgi:glycolate oxidase iron-sulfur subunit